MGRKKKKLDLYSLGSIIDDDRLDVYTRVYDNLAIKTINERQIRFILQWLKPYMRLNTNEFNFIPKSFVDHYYISKTYAYDADKIYNAIYNMFKELSKRDDLISWNIIKYVDQELQAEDIIKAKVISLLFPYEEEYLYAYKDKPEMVEILKKYYNMLK